MRAQTLTINGLRKFSEHTEEHPQAGIQVENAR